MKIHKTDIENCFEITTDLFEDSRGYFHATYNLDELNLNTQFIQDNESYSKYGTIRGLHFQKDEYAQAKLVRCPYGEVIDVVVDIRPSSPTFRKVLVFELFKPNKMVFIPKGCAHGFAVLSEYAIFQYKVDAPYKKDYEAGININDPIFNINWRIPKNYQIISEKDNQLPFFS